MVSSINVRGYGSLTNAIENQTRSLKPEVGMGVTELCYSDRHPYTVVKILSERRIQVRADKATRVDENGMSECQRYTYETDENSPAITLRLNKHERWKQVGCPDGKTYFIGEREEYYDFTR